MDDVKQVEVTQADREAAANFLFSGMDVKPSRNMREGARDRHPSVQSFARHRISAEAATEAKQAAEIAALRERVAMLEGVMEDTRDVLDDASHRIVADPYIVVELRALCERAGYGNVMSSASELWRSRLGEQAGGEFVAGPCRKTVQNTITRIDTALKDTTT